MPNPSRRQSLEADVPGSAFPAAVRCWLLPGCLIRRRHPGQFRPGCFFITVIVLVLLTPEGSQPLAGG